MKKAIAVFNVPESCRACPFYSEWDDNEEMYHRWDCEPSDFESGDNDWPPDDRRLDCCKLVIIEVNDNER